MGLVIARQDGSSYPHSPANGVQPFPSHNSSLIGFKRFLRRDELAQYLVRCAALEHEAEAGINQERRARELRRKVSGVHHRLSTLAFNIART